MRNIVVKLTKAVKFPYEDPADIQIWTLKISFNY